MFRSIHAFTTQADICIVVPAVPQHLPAHTPSGTQCYYYSNILPR